MRQDKINKELYDNINISEEMMESIIKDVNKGRRRADFRFRYSTAILAFIIIAVAGFGGLGVSAAYLSYKNRVEEMPESEKQVYQQELSEDVYNTDDEARTRSLTDTERQRYMELEEAYYTDGVFPQDIMKHVEKLDEISADELAFVEEINKIHMPEGEMSDEQLLQLIDHQAKYLYTMEKNAEENGWVEETEDNIPASEKQAIKEQCVALIKEYYGAEINDSWNCDIIDNDWDGLWATYDVRFSENDSPSSTFYQFLIPKQEGGMFMCNCGGKDYFKDTKEYSRQEAEAFVEKGKEAVLKFVKENFGLGEPERIEILGFENGLGEEIPSSEICFQLYYGEDPVEIDWNIDQEKIFTISGYGLLK